MSLNKLLETLLSEFPEDDDDTDSSRVINFIKKYIETEQKNYTENKDNNKLTFGKFKGYSVKELALTDKGIDYLQWLLSQSWCTEDKFGMIYDECKKLNIKKKKLPVLK